MDVSCRGCRLPVQYLNESVPSASAEGTLGSVWAHL